MSIIRLPTLDDLSLDEKLRRNITEKGGKVGVLDWIADTDRSIPILKHTPMKEAEFSEIKMLAKTVKSPLMVRSNNPCEYLPGTEGIFETVCVYDFDSVSDEIVFRALHKLPECPAPHLERDWPKSQSDMRYGIVPLINKSCICNLIEHPNVEGAFWMSISNANGPKWTFLSDGSTMLGHDDEFKEFKNLNPNFLEDILSIARKVSGMDGLDNRYTKQMEFGFNKEDLYLTQVKLFVPRNPKPAPNIRLDEIIRPHIYRAFGEFNVDVTLLDGNTEYHERKKHEKIGLVLEQPSSVSGRGQFYTPNVSVAIFWDARGLLQHSDIPYLIYTDGAAVGNRGSSALLDDGTNNHVRVHLSTLIGKKVNLRGDGHYLYVKPLE